MTIAAGADVEADDIATFDTRLDTLEAGAWTAYTPVWAASGTAVSLGNGTIVGRYYQLGKLVVASVRLLAGTTTTFGTGTYSFTLPVTAATTSSLFRHGAAYLRDSSAASTGHFVGTAIIDTSNPGSAILANVNQIVGATVPFTWANTDHLSFTIAYEAA
jgi:hypothetical protein